MELFFNNDTATMIQNFKLGRVLTTLESNGLILFPTDTVWAIGCDATQPEAIRRLQGIKTEQTADPFIVLVDSIDMLKKYVRHVHPRIETLLHFHTRPLTVMYEAGDLFAANWKNPGDQVAVRIPQDPFCQSLIATYDRPLIATAANTNNLEFPTSFGEVRSDVIEQVDFVVPYRQKARLTSGPSVIAQLSDRGELEFIRE
jgi:L-threonylcarbamoyladenylate synthase